MFAAARARLSYANVMATAAVFIALGGTGYAAITLAPNSVGSKQLKKGAVTSKKIAKNAVTSSTVKDGSLLAADFNAAALGQFKGPKGDPGAAGVTGATGATGDTGPRGPSDGYFAYSADPCKGGTSPNFASPANSCLATLSLTLPAGNYLVLGKVSAGNPTGTVGDAECYFADNSDIAMATVPTTGETVNFNGTKHFGTATLTITAAKALPNGGKVTMTCQNTGASDIPNGANDLVLGYEALRAIQVATLH